MSILAKWENLQFIHMGWRPSTRLLAINLYLFRTLMKDKIIGNVKGRDCHNKDAYDQHAQNQKSSTIL